MTHFVGIIDCDGGTWGVRIPDCPGAYGAGDTADKAIASAIAGLSAWSEAALKDGEDLPAPRTLQDIAADAATAPAAGEMAVLIPLLLDEGRPVKATLSLDAGMLKAIDREASLRGLTRSAFLVSAARDKIAARAQSGS